MGILPLGFARHHANALSFGVRLLDIAIFVISALLVPLLIDDQGAHVAGREFLATILGLTVALTFELGGLYRPWRGDRLISETFAIVRASIRSLCVSVLVFAILDSNHLNATIFTLIVSALGVGTIGVVFQRLMLRTVLRTLRKFGYNQRRVLLVGLSRQSAIASTKIINSPWTGYRLVGYVDDRLAPREGSIHVKRLGSVGEIEYLAAELKINEIWVGYPMAGERRVAQALHVLRHCTMCVRFLLDANAFDITRCSMTEIAGMPALDMHHSPFDDSASRLAKALFDRATALALLILASPVMLAISIGVKLSSPGPVLYRQVRVGWRNQHFMMFKFRTMPVNVEGQSGPVWAKRADCRATRFGSFLRRTSLDELPQLLNVLRGDMSIVGPRPERPEFVEKFKDEIPWYMKKHMVKAGITGWAQVNGWRGDTDLTRRIEHDLFYIQNWSLGFDMRIILQTFRSGFVNHNAY